MRHWMSVLKPGPPVKNIIWDILTRLKFAVWVYRERLSANTHERMWGDVLRFHWVYSLKSKIIEILRFANLVFGLTKSPFILEGTLEMHFEKYRDSFEELIRIIENDA